jgi:NAD(P)-dependent dehydrogenase (short-subunit alcohol dehydrogenase family)
VRKASGSVAVITGAASGIGRATSERLGGRGDNLVLVDVAADALNDATTSLQAQGCSVVAYPIDVRDAAAIREMSREIGSRFGSIRYLMSNAGGGPPRSILDLTLIEWLATIDTHVSAAYSLCRAALPYMQSGAILFTSSDFAVVGYPGYAHYSAAKAALYSLAKSLAVELAPAIRVNALGPGPIDTPHLHRVFPQLEWDEARRRFESEVPMRRLGRPEEVASVASFLLSDEASYITGQLIQPNGGQVMW